MNTKKILYINGGIMHRGGIESYMMNYYRHFDRERLQIDFIVHGFEKGVYDDEIESLGGKIHHVAVKSMSPIQNVRQIREILQTGEYKLIHSHMDAMSYVPLKIAKQCGVPIRIAHSHNTQHLTNNPIKIQMNEYAKHKLPSVATHLFACTEKAGIWMFGEKNRNRIEIVPNAIDTTKYAFNKELRIKIRSELGFKDDDIVLGHVGRFDYQKNHEFLVDMFAELAHKNNRYKLVMIGDGQLKENILKKINAMGIEKQVRIIAACPNVNEYYNAFDLFCLPSHFEGLGIVLIEAQTNGLFCIAADAVPQEADVTGNIMFLKLLKEKWVNAILQKKQWDRIKCAEEKVITAGYSIVEQAKILQQRYEVLLNL